MRKLFITTYSRDYPGQLVLTLPAKKILLGFCCREPETSGAMRQAYVFEVQAPSRNRKHLPRKSEVLRVRASLTPDVLAKAHHTSHFVQVC